MSRAAMVSIVEGEGLFNDATALVAFRVAVAAVVGGSFSLANAGMDFVLAAAGGVAIGLAIGWVVAEIRKRTEDAQVSITISLLTGYAAFIPANAIGASGVLAAVTAGIYMGVRGPQHHLRANPAPGTLRLGHPRLPDQRGAVRARRPRSFERWSTAARWLLGRRPGRLRPGGQRRRRRHAHRLGRSPCRTSIRALDRRQSQRARRTSRRVAARGRVERDAGRGVARRRARDAP